MIPEPRREARALRRMQAFEKVRHLPPRSSLVGTLAVISLAAAMSSCGSGKNLRPAQATPDTRQFDSALYYDELKGDLSLPGLPSVSVTEARWRDLVTRERAGGLAALTSAERSIVLQGAIKYYLTVVGGTERVIDVSGVGSAHVLERYSSKDGLYTALSERETMSSGILVGWGDLVYREPGQHHVAEFETTDGGKMVVEGWTFGQDGSVSCDRATDQEGIGFGAYTYYSNLKAIVGAADNPKRVSLTGTAMELIVFPYGSAQEQVWLDEHSMFPLRFQFPEVRDERNTQLQPEKVITVTSINPEQTISHPNGPCGS